MPSRLLASYAFIYGKENEMSNVLVTGGAGFIGSHTVISLLEHGHEVVIVDNFVNSTQRVLDQVRKLIPAGTDFVHYNISVQYEAGLREIFRRHEFDCVIHFAGLKAVGESSIIPLEYYTNNISGTLTLLKVMKEFGVKNLIFSSSATVYGNPRSLPIYEDFSLSVTNPYGRTKLMAEEILIDLVKAEPDWKVVLLRYFNPIGAHESGEIGEDPSGIPNNLLPYVTQVAVGKLETVSVYGDDYETKDGTGVRDYIHVVDLAEGHVAAIGALDKLGPLSTFNLGTGNGYSVLEIISKTAEITGKDIPYQIVGRRAGDVGEVYANAALAKEVLGWEAKRDLDKMIRDSWNWQSKHPNGLN